MAKYRHSLPQLPNNLFLTDGGLETTLLFQEGFDLPEFAAFDLFRYEAGYQALKTYFETYANIAVENQVGLILESATWRANPAWGAKLGYANPTLATINHQAIALLHGIRKTYETAQSPMVISGCLGPRGDGYIPTEAMTVGEATDYHRMQIEVFRDAEVDLVTAMTMNYVEEAIGITQAAQQAGMPLVISFTVETDGRLPTGQPLAEAIMQVDAMTHSGPAYYMINCAHPSHFAAVLTADAAWVKRIRGIRANASTKSHTELNESEALDDGNPEELGRQYRQLRERFPHFTVLGGCCGTDHRHVEAICRACLPVLWHHLAKPSLLQLL
ncbi:MAG: homocysteine S-methyltransferase family protein [Leptolyngbyaceae cyanobacterium SM2_5_2]|nr:homocysteine S-methyltransferase family protein [Leptolyngbyaceae cyanobacterium SM2_5_2]